MEQNEERFAVVGDKIGGGCFTDYVIGRAQATKNARWYRGRGYKVKVYPADKYLALIEAQEPGTFNPKP